MKNTYLKFSIPLFLFISLTIMSCEELFNNAEEEQKLTQTEIIEGLKKALEIGADSAISITSKTDGFYKDEIIKILLPPEADVILDKLDNPILANLGIEEMLEDVLLRLNRAAEKAAAGATNIFINAITNMTIDEGLYILYGTNPLDSIADENTFDSTAATGYLISTTYDNLLELFSPIMDEALDEPLVANISTNQAWNALQDLYNGVATSPLNFALGWETVHIDLSDHATAKGLDGLFIKVKDEEKKIRENPLDWAINIIQKVFGYVKDNPDK